MYQVSLVSAEVGKTSDLLSGKGDVSNKNSTKGNAFSDAMEQHYPKNNSPEAEGKKSQGGNLESKAAEQQPINVKSGATIKVKRDDLGDARTLPVPFPVDNVSSKEQLTAVNKAVILPQQFPIDIEAISAKLKAEKANNDDAHTLPVPLPIDDESLLTQPLAESAYIVSAPISAEEKILNPAAESPLIPVNKTKGDEHTLPVPVVPVQVNNSTVTSAIGTSSDESTVAKQYKASLLNSSPKTPISGQNIAQKVESDDAVDLLKMLNGAQKFLTKPTQEELSAKQSESNKLAMAESVIKGEQVTSASKQDKALSAEQIKPLASANNVTQLASAKFEQKINHETSVNHLAANASSKIDQSSLSNTATGVAKSEANAANSIAASLSASDKLTSTDNGVVIKASDNAAKDLGQNVAEKTAAKHASTELPPLSSAKTNSEVRNIEQNIADESDLISQKTESTHLANENKYTSAEAQASKDLASIKHSQLSLDGRTSKLDFKATKPVPEVISQTNKLLDAETKAQVTEVQQTSGVNFSRINGFEPSSASANSQNTAAILTASTAEQKTDAAQKNAVIDDVSKLANTTDEEQTLLKSQSEKQAPLAEKTVSAFNQTISHTLDAQAARTMTNTAELAAHQERSFESTINQLTSTTVQAQKSITAMQTETIAIYRKDFADAVKDKVMVMINQKIQQVEIQLDPPEMGNIHVRVNLQNEQAAVQFIVQNQQAKDALEQNMGKLREMLAENGVDVGDANIEQRQAKDQNDKNFEQATHNGANPETTEDGHSDNDNVELDMVKASSTGVDYYA